MGIVISDINHIRSLDFRGNNRLIGRLTFQSVGPQLLTSTG